MSIKLAATLITVFTLSITASEFDLKTATSQLYRNIQAERKALLGERGMEVFKYIGQFHPQSHLPGLFEKEVAAGNIRHDSTFEELQEKCPELRKKVDWAVKHYTKERIRCLECLLAKTDIPAAMAKEYYALSGKRGMEVFKYIGQFHPQSHLPRLFEKEVADGNIRCDSTFEELKEKCPTLARNVQWAMEHYTGERKRAILHLFEQAGFALP